MSIKQDRSAARTAADIERKYSFGKKFSEILGLIDESRDKVDSVESSLRGEITKTETTLRRNTEEIVAEAKADITKTVGDEITEISKEVELKINSTEASLTAAKTEINNSINGINNSITEISNKVELKVDANAVNIAIDRRMAMGVDQVETTTGYRFDHNGLNISKTGNEITNRLDNTGMYVQRYGENILAANNKGVEATNLHAKTYLIIGAGNGRSRIEDYGTNRTGVFWIGG